ncbi:MAG: hypothetical protein ACOX8Q_00180 [Christensenellales bacterium]|jgi:hypothetical protein
MYEVKVLDKKSRHIKKFIKLEFKMYKDDENWVAPLKSDTKKLLKGKENPLFENGDQAFFMVYKGKRPVGRILVGIDEELNRVRGFKQGFFSMFECIDDAEACKVLLDASCNWLSEKGMDRIIGPLSPSNGDDRKGFVVMGEGPPVLLNAHTKKYYPKLIEKYGFTKNDDHYAYLFIPKEIDIERHRKAVEFAKRKGGFRVDKINIKDMMGEAKAIKQVLDNSIPEEWDYLVAPSLDAVIKEFKSLAQFYDGNFCYIARKGDIPIGFMIALPDYNQVLKRMNGKILPIGWAKFLYYRRKITGARALVQMVDRNYHNLGVNYAMYFEAYQDWLKTNGRLQYVEASCIDEVNTSSRISVERVGGKHYRTYRTYRYDLNNK